MAGQSKVRFKLEDLKKKALAAIDLQIHEAQEHLKSISDDDALADQRTEWRETVHHWLTALSADFDGLTDKDMRARLAMFPAYPMRDEYAVVRQAQRLRILEQDRTKILAKAESLVPDEDGNISLTKTALSDYFGL
jgi:septation ring formation regulator EzrA